MKMNKTNVKVNKLIYLGLPVLAMHVLAWPCKTKILKEIQAMLYGYR